MQRSRSLAALAVALSTSVAMAQLNVVIPDGTANAPGNTSNAFPWGTTAAAWPGLRLLATYDAVNFTNQNVAFPILISGLKWRPNDTSAAVAGGQFNLATVELSTSPVGWAGNTTSYPAAHGADRTVVYDASVDGPVIHTATPGSGAWTPQSWCVDITFSTPWLYDPASGDLVVDVDYPTGSFAGGGVGQMDIHTGLASRIFGSTLYPAANGTTMNHGPVIEVNYVPASGLYSIFDSDVQTGPSPLTVNFQDLSYSSGTANNQPIAWQWDFENDGTIDSTLQNPSHTYSACGTYDVALTVIDGVVANPVTSVKTAFIVTDTVVADFSEALLAPLVVQFTDTSAGSPTTWAWDLDGDGVTDSTVQNPGFAYPNTSPVNVSLTVSRACGPTDTFTKTVVPAQKLTTTFANNNSGGDGWSMVVDLDVTAPGGLTIDGLDINSVAALGTAFSLDLYVSNTKMTVSPPTANVAMNPGDWVLIGTASGSTAGVGLPSNAVMATSAYLPAGSYALLVHHIGAAPAYTNGNMTFSNGDMTINTGFSRASSVADPFVSANTFNPRSFNTTIYYSTFGFTGLAGYGEFGPGCPGSQGQSSLTASAAPTLNSTMTVTVDNMPAPEIGFMLTGFSNTTSVLGPLPFDAGPLGAPGCFLRVDPLVTAFLAGAGGTANWVLTIPNDPSLNGVKFFQQCTVVDPAANAAGAVASGAAAMIIGL